MPNFHYNDHDIRFLDHVIMFLVLCVSGNPIFVLADTKWLYVMSAALMTCLCVLYRRRIIADKPIKWIGGAALLFTMQLLCLDEVSVPADVNFLFRLWFAFMAASFFGTKFREVYLRTMTFICLVSIPLYVLYLATGRYFGYEFNRYYTIGIYNMTIPSYIDPYIRNSGMFWEPGAFQGYIMLIPLLFSDKLGYLWKERKTETIILIVAFLLTQSTTAYITFASFITLTILTGRKLGILQKATLLAGIAFMMIYVVWGQDFMGEKIMAQFEDAQEIRNGDVSWSRMGALVIDLQNIAKHPIVGNGFLMDSKYGAIGELMGGAGNGFSGATNTFGIPFMIIYFIAIFKNYRCFTNAQRWIFVLVIVLLLNGEYFLNFPMFFSLLFIKIPSDEIRARTSTHTQVSFQKVHNS